MPLEEVSQGIISQAEVDRIAQMNKPAGFGSIFQQIAEAARRAAEARKGLGAPALPTPTGPRGATRWDDLLRTNAGLYGGQRQGDAYWRWVLSLKDDPSDPEFTNIIRTKKASARYYQATGKEVTDLTQLGAYMDEPAQGSQPPPKKKPKKLKGADWTPDAEKRYMREVDQYQKMAGSFQGEGTPLKYQNETGGGPIVPVDPELQNQINGAATGSPVNQGTPLAIQSWEQQLSAMNAGDALKAGVTQTASGYAGSWVFVGYQTYTDSQGRVYRKPVYRANTDAYQEVAKMGGKDLKQLQHNLGLPETGVPDDSTVKAWGELVDITSRQNLAGKDITVADVYLQVSKALEDARRRAGSGGGGAGSGVDLTTAKAILTGAMKEFAGREPTDAEAKVFWRKLQGAWGSSQGNMDAGQFATDYVRAAFAAETKETSTVDFYGAMMDVLGGGGVNLG